MPEFIIDESGASAAYEALDDFAKGYIECVFFTNQCPNWVGDSEFTIANWFSDDVQSAVREGQSDGVIPSDCTVGHIHPDSIAFVAAHCTKWQADHVELLARAYAAHWRKAAQAEGWGRVAHSGMFTAPLGHELRLVDYESWEALCEAEGIEPGEAYDEAQAGRDLFYDQEGHGVGFTDREQLDVYDHNGATIGELLMKAAGHREAQIWFGDHVENGNAPWVYIA